MAEKVAVIEKEFSELAEKLKLTHQSLTNNYEVLTKKLEGVVPQSGPLYAPEFSPKIQGLVEVIDTDIITRLERLFEITEEVIKNYEEAIINSMFKLLNKSDLEDIMEYELGNIVYLILD